VDPAQVNLYLTMKPSVFWRWSLSILMLLLSVAGPALAGTGSARLYCLSLKFARGSDTYNEYYLDFTTLQYGINGELVRNFGGTYSHFSYLELTDNWLGTLDQGAIAVDLPNTDANGNGFPDFLEVAQSVNASSTGQYQILGLSSGTVQATWFRAAGEHTGSCTLRFKPSPVYVWLTFACTFEVLEYTGAFPYTNANGKATATVALRQTELPDYQLAGDLELTRSPTNRLNQLDFPATYWTNSYLQTLELASGSLFRDSQWPTNYSGYVDFADGEPNTPDPDYQTWILSVDDTNDANGNGIPDLSDDTTAAPPRPPTVIVRQGGGQLQFTISGDLNHTNFLQETIALGTTNWSTIQTFVLTKDPQTVSVPIPVGNRFWRVVAQ